MAVSENVDVIYRMSQVPFLLFIYFVVNRRLGFRQAGKSGNTEIFLEFMLLNFQ